MRKSEIKIQVKLDDNNIPEKIFWEAEDNPDEGISETKCINLAIWDPKQKNTLRIDLWNKEMTTDEMKQFYLDCLSGMAQTILNATGDEFISSETNLLCEKISDYIEADQKK